MRSDLYFYFLNLNLKYVSKLTNGNSGFALSDEFDVLHVPEEEVGDVAHDLCAAVEVGQLRAGGKSVEKVSGHVQVQLLAAAHPQAHSAQESGPLPGQKQQGPQQRRHQHQSANLTCKNCGKLTKMNLSLECVTKQN